ncbi:MAG: Gldg family protein, partial [Chloroflexota bacterium]
MKPRTQKLLLTLGRVSLFLVLLLLPTALRAGFYYRRIYAPQAVPRPELGAVDVPTVALEAPADRDVRQGRGRIVIDRAHENTLDDADLNVLLARLTARSIETVSLLPGDPLSDALRDAIALVVIAPHLPFQVWEIEAVQRFVEQGGRVLLIADPSRYSFRYEYDDYYGEYAVPESDVASINSLAAAFGLSFADDYIYNTAENAGNFQYVVLQDFASHPLTAGLEQVIFYAAHSIATGEQAVVTADEHTSSSLSEQTGGLVTVSLDGNSQVLAVADFTFMTEPYNGSADNNRLVANIADFLVGAERVYTLTDFPHFFGDEVHLVPLMGLSQDDALAVDAIEQANSLQSTFEAAGKRLYWRAQPQAGHDTLFLGLYGGVDFAAEPGQILASRGISFTLETIERARATPTPTPRRTPTP